MPCWRGPKRPKQLSMAANIQAHSFFEGFQYGLSPSDPRGHSALFSGCVIISTYVQHSYIWYNRYTFFQSNHFKFASYIKSVCGCRFATSLIPSVLLDMDIWHVKPLCSRVEINANELLSVSPLHNSNWARSFSMALTKQLHQCKTTVTQIIVY